MVLGGMMKYDFDKVIDRRKTSCMKWDYLKEFFGEDDLNSMWIADMDFMTPPEILSPIVDRAMHGVFGYTGIPDEFFNAVISWFSDRYGWKIRKEWITAAPGVVPALNLVIQEFTDKGDGIIIQPPVYFPFRDSIDLNERKLLNNELLLVDGRYEIDWKDLEEKAESARLFIFCSPHNPVSRVWTKDELERLGEICADNDLLVFSDEIHADIVFKPFRHLPTGLVSDDLAGRTISAYATSKTFNLAGLQMSINVIPDEEIRKQFGLSMRKLHLNMSGIFGITGTQAAYSNGKEWLEELLLYLWRNVETVRAFLNEKIPEILLIEPEGTYLLWLDCRRLGMNDDELADFFVREAGLALSSGIMFGPGGSGFMRMNIGCPVRSILSALSALEKAVKTHS